MANERRAQNKARSQAAKAARLAEARRQRRQRTIAIVAMVGVAALIGGIAVNGMSGSNSDSSSSTTTSSTAPGSPPKATPVSAGKSVKGTTPCPAADGSSPRTSEFEKAPPMCIDPNKKYTADFDTTEGHIVVELDTKRTPGVTNNFVVLSRYHYYDGSAIFRTDPSIDIIQGGGPNTQDNSDPGPGYTITDEGAPFTYKEGDLVMANTGSPNSSGAQFFFGTGPNVSNLNGSGTYLNFGHTIQGLDVLKKIIALHQETGSLGGAPSKLVIINKITITES